MQLIEIGEVKENQGHIEYKKDDGNYSKNIPTGIDAKTYNIFYKIVGNGNYNDSLEENFSVKIAKANPKVTKPTAKTLTYTGNFQELINPGETTGGAMQYSLDGKNYSENIPTGIEVTAYTVYYRVQGDNNYKILNKKV